MPITPMMQQYLDMKEQYRDCILMFRLGDFYEMFFEDATTASRELEITLTGRDCGLDERAPMCGVPFHAVDGYISRLITKGYKVAICEQMEDPALAKGIVKREVIKIVTPGTITDTAMLDEKKNNYLVSVYAKGLLYGLAIVDISTGEFSTTRITWGNTLNKLLDEIAKYSPAEIIANGAFFAAKEPAVQVGKRFSSYISQFDDQFFEEETAALLLEQRLGEGALAEDTKELCINASGALLSYLEQTQKASLEHIQRINPYKLEEYMMLDISTRRNLELTETMREKARKGTLLWVLDRTMTSMGARTLRRWVEQPLVKTCDIQERLETVAEFKDKFMVRMELRERLKRVHDIERLMGKIVLGSANCRDLIALKNSLYQIPFVKEILGNCASSLAVRNNGQMDGLEDICAFIENAIIDDPPLSVKEGGIIKTGYHEEVDKLRHASTDGKQWIASLESRVRPAPTGMRR